MKVLRINSLGGLMNQLYSNEQYVKEQDRTYVQDGYLDANSLFWSSIFSQYHVKSLILQAERALKHEDSPKIRAILEQPDTFYSIYQKALDQIAIIDEPNVLFNILETLEMICTLHSKLISSPFILSVSHGYIHSKFSAFDMEKTCLLPYCNPYLSFVKEEILPLIKDYMPDVLILSGSPTLASFAIAKLAKVLFPKLLIVAADFESDYYSLRKIEKLLLKNAAFFSVYDCVILDNDDTIVERIASLKEISSCALKHIPNIIFCLDAGQTIVKTATLQLPIQETAIDYIGISERYVHNMRAFPQNHCYWNRCSFCGINSKFTKKENCEWDIESLIQRIKRLLSKGVKYIWFLDEAIPYHVLKVFADRIIKENLYFIWHIRTRIEPQYVDADLIEKLYKAGLRHVLFGLESASKRILSLMEKTNYINEYLDIAECIVREFTHRGIKTHFSAIIGFPSETETEREETVRFLCYLAETYCDFSYNVNSFYLDIGSKMFSQWEEFDIVSLSFPCAPKYFLDNKLDWNSSVSAELSSIVQSKKEALMECQYEWYPNGALIEPSEFFAFYEYSRLPLLLTRVAHQKQSINNDSVLVLAPTVSCCKIDQQTWLLYNLENHHYVIGGKMLFDLVNAHKINRNFSTLLENYDIVVRPQAKELITQLIKKGFWV